MAADPACATCHGTGVIESENWHEVEYHDCPTCAAPEPQVVTAEEFNAMQAKQATRKYRNKPVVIDGIRFDSTAEGNRYVELKRLQDAGEIRLLTLQPRAVLEVNGVKVGTYVGDFKYLDPDTGKFVIEDVKGVRTPVYVLKRKLVKAIYGIEIVEVKR